MRDAGGAVTTRGYFHLVGISLLNRPISRLTNTKSSILFGCIHTLFVFGKDSLRCRNSGIWISLGLWNRLAPPGLFGTLLLVADWEQLELLGSERLASNGAALSPASDLEHALTGVGQEVRRVRIISFGQLVWLLL